MAPSKNGKVESLRLPCLTITESADEVASIYEQLHHEINPTTFIERMYVDDMIALTWDIVRFRRYKTGVINAAFLPALQGILEQLLCGPDSDPQFDYEAAAEELARGWYEDGNVKAKVATLLRKSGLDESVVEAEAFRLRAEDLERLDRMLTLAEVRRDRALRSIANLRQVFSKRLREAAERIIDNDDVPQLVMAD